MRRLVVSVLFVLATARLGAEPDASLQSWKWVGFTTEFGLPSNAVDSVIETPAGLVWAATDQGLAWFDGHQWHKMTLKEGLPERSASGLLFDRREGVFALIEDVLYRGGRAGFAPLVLEYEQDTLVRRGDATLARGRLLLSGAGFRLFESPSVPLQSGSRRSPGNA